MAVMAMRQMPMLELRVNTYGSRAQLFAHYVMEDVLAANDLHHQPGIGRIETTSTS